MTDQSLSGLQVTPFCRKLWLAQRASDASLDDAELLKETKWGRYVNLSVARDEHRGKSGL